MSMISSQVKELRKLSEILEHDGVQTYEASLVARAADTIEELSAKAAAQPRWPVGGVDRTGKVDRISIENAVETPFWMAIWATEPEREVDVRMSYSDLKVVCDMIDFFRERKKKGGTP